MKTINNRYYFSVNECLNGEVDGIRWKDFANTASGIFASRDITYQAWEWIELLSGATANPIASKFVDNFLSLKADSICFASDNPTLNNGDFLNDDYRRFLARFLSWWNETFPKYQQLIEYYENSDGKLMTGVVSSTKTETDGTDTTTNSAVPTSTTYQSYPSNEDDVAEGSHSAAHNETDVTSETASEDLIDHLDKLRNKIVDLYSEWLKSFEERFILYVGD